MSTAQLIATAYPGLRDSDVKTIETGISESGAEYVEFRRGDAIETSGKRDDNRWIVVSGNFVIYVKDIFVAEIGPGNLIGEQAITERNPNQVISITADRVSAALRIPRKNWDRLMLQQEQSAAWSRLLVHNLSRKLANTTTLFIEHVNAEVEKEQLLKMFVSEFSLGHVKAFLHGDVSSYKKTNALIFFSDLEGFSAHLAALSADEAGRVTRAMLQVQADKLGEAGAQIDKFMGDGLMSYWISEDDELDPDTANRAVETACSILTESAHVSESIGMKIGLRIGMHFGQAIAGNFGCDGRIAHTLIGPEVNLAARYEQVRTAAGEPMLGPIRLSPVVYRAIPRDLQSRFQGPTFREVKHGVKIPVHDGPFAA